MMRGTGFITINTNPPAIVYVDSVLVTDDAGNPLVTPMKIELNEGMHRFQMVDSGYTASDFEHIYIFPGSDLILDRDLAIEYPPPQY